MKALPWSALAMCIDCEGCISICHGNSVSYPAGSNGRYSMEISVRNTDRRLMDWLISNFGGRYQSTDQKADWKVSHLWRVTGRANREKILLGILPYLILKKEQALLALDFIRIPKFERQPERRHELMLACKKLNTRGRPAPTTNTLDNPESGLKIESDLASDNESALEVIRDGDKIPEVFDLA